MRVYFLRHGIAVDEAGFDGPDARRPLTAEGRAIVAEVADRLAALGVTADAMLTSPFTRAAETASIAAEKLGLGGVLDEDPRLESGFGIGELRGILAEHSSAEAIVLVGHEPDFSRTVGELIGGGAVKLKKAGFARVDVPDPVEAAAGVLVWLAQPALLRP